MKCLKFALMTALAATLCFAGGLRAAPALTPETTAQVVIGGDIAAATKGALTFLHFSDPHWGESKGGFSVSPELSRRALAEAVAVYPRAALAAFAGDIGSRAVFDEIAAGAPFKVFGVPGNGERGTYLDPWTIVDSVRREDYPLAPWRDDGSKLEMGDSLFIFLDSALPRGHEGALAWDRMRWVHETLSRTADKNVFIFLHHGDRQMINQDWFDDMLGWHRPRFRSIVVCSGHDHSLQADLTVKRSIVYLRSGSIQSGYFRVFHVFSDHIITYTRSSRAYAEMAAAGRENPQAQASLSSFSPLATEPSFISAGRRPAARPVDPAAYWAMSSEYAVRTNENAPLGRYVLRLDLGAPASGPGYISDRSGYGNHIYGNSIFLDRDPGRFQVEREGRRGMVFGPGGVWELSGFDSYSLNSPALHNGVTLETEVFIPVQPVGWEQGILGKGSYDISLDGDGRLLFRLWVMEKKRRRIVLRSQEPLPAGKWLQVKGGFDGKTARLLLDGKLLASEEAEAGARILPAAGPKSPGAAVGFYFSQPHASDRKNLIIGSVGIAVGWKE